MADKPSLFANRKLQVVLAAVCILVLCGCGLMTAILPDEADLFERLYGNARHGKPESTAVFMFVFPSMLSAGCIAACWRAEWFSERAERQPSMES